MGTSWIVPGTRMATGASLVRAVIQRWRRVASNRYVRREGPPEVVPFRGLQLSAGRPRLGCSGMLPASAAHGGRPRRGRRFRPQPELGEVDGSSVCRVDRGGAPGLPEGTFARLESRANETKSGGTVKLEW